MVVKINKQLQRFWPLIAFLLLAVTVFATSDFDQQYLVLAVIMLLLPVVDGRWEVPTNGINKKHVFLWVAIIFIAMGVISLEPDLLAFFFSTLVFVAFPEEWFFRAYLMERIGRGMKANVIASICFSALHAITLSWVSSLLVFIPSLVFGWIYQKQRNIVTVILIHAISNLIYTTYLYRYFENLY